MLNYDFKLPLTRDNIKILHEDLKGNPLTDKIRVDVELGNGHSLGVTFPPESMSKAVDLLVDDLLRRVTGITRHDILMVIADNG